MKKLHLVLFVLVFLSSASVFAEKKINLNLTVHIMRDIEMNVKGHYLNNNHITKQLLDEQVLPEVNKIWSQADIKWNLVKVYDELVVKENYEIIPLGFPTNFEGLKKIVENAKRDNQGKSDPKRLVPLFLFMKPENKIKFSNFGTNDFHVYIFPFIGNTSQGNAMRKSNIANSSLGFHTVVGSWSNKHNRGGQAKKTEIVEGWNQWTYIKYGSLSRTISHELGHVLGLSHNQCIGNCLMGPIKGGRQGYMLDEKQIKIARKFAHMRYFNLCKPLKICGYSGKMALFK